MTANTTKTADPLLTLTPEFGEPNTAPLSYWLRSWGRDRSASAALREAAAGRRSYFSAPLGMMYVSPA